jgi:predicted ATPase/DNA-binding SARP family transcriptional activator
MPVPLRITTFGEFALLGPGGPIDAPFSAVARSLFITLARARRPFTRDELAARWWPDAEPQRARASLSTVLWSLRTALRDALQCDPLATTRDIVAIDPNLSVEIDADDFEAALASGDDASAELWYAGPYLRGVAEEDVEAERERLSALYEAALARLLATDPDPERARRLIVVDPYAEIAYRVLVDDALGNGTSAGARAWLRRARSAFAEIGATPAFLEQQPYRGLGDVDGDRVPRTNLPSENTSFIGRDDDLRIVGDALRDARVVTILGAGGSGKTRLAREVATRALGARNSAVWFVDLTPFEGAGAVEEAIAAALDLRADGHERAVAIGTALRDSDALLVLDNCEHLIEAAADAVVRLSREAPLVRVLTTSREALRIEAETIVPIEGLAPADAAQLFLVRARAADRRLTIDADAAACAARIAGALDGLPLAIELAAGRVRVDGLRAIADDALHVVGGAVGPRDSVQRSQTIAASIAWSVERLDPQARTFYARLGAFAGTFDIEDGSALDLDGSDALDRLIDRSLVVRTSAFAPALRLLAPVRADARERLAADPRQAEVLDAYAERILANATAWLARRTGDQAVAAENALDALAGDIERTLERLFAQERAETAIDFTTALASHWAARGSRAPAERWLTRGDAAVADDRRRGDLAYARVRFAHDTAQAGEMLRLGELARDAYERAGDRSGLAKSLNVIGSGLLVGHRVREAIAALERSLQLQRELGDEFGVAVALTNLGNAAASAGDLDAALAAYEECAPIFDRFSTIQARVKVQNNIAYVRLLQNDRPGSALASARAIALAEVADNDAMIAFACTNAAVRAARSGDYDDAVALARRVGSTQHATTLWIAYGLIARAVAAAAAGDASARRFASAARALEDECGGFETFEAGILAPISGDRADAVDRDHATAAALLRS